LEHGSIKLSDCQEIWFSSKLFLAERYIHEEKTKSAIFMFKNPTGPEKNKRQVPPFVCNECDTYWPFYIFHAGMGLQIELKCGYNC
jgi:hypothetical protein